MISSRKAETEFDIISANKHREELIWRESERKEGLAFGFYSVMLTSTVLGLITMVLFKPRSWCVYCPMGTMTQLICKAKNTK